MRGRMRSNNLGYRVGQLVDLVAHPARLGVYMDYDQGILLYSKDDPFLGQWDVDILPAPPKLPTIIDALVVSSTENYNEAWLDGWEDGRRGLPPKQIS